MLKSFIPFLNVCFNTFSCFKATEPRQDDENLWRVCEIKSDFIPLLQETAKAQTIIDKFQRKSQAVLRQLLEKTPKSFQLHQEPSFRVAAYTKRKEHPAL